MRQFPVLIFFLALGIAAAPVLRAQSSDPSDLFLNAYMSVQKAQKLEEDGKYKLALQKYRYAAGLLEQIRDKSPDWQPVIVTYRLNKTSEAIALLQKKIDVEGPGSTVPEVETPLPASPGDNSGTPTLTGTPPPGPRVEAPGATSGDPFTDMRDRYERMQKELADMKKKYDDSVHQNTELLAKLNTTTEQLNKARVEESQTKAQLEQAEEAYKNAVADKTRDTEGQKELKDEIARLQNELKDRDAERDAAQDANDEAEKKIASIGKERDNAVDALNKSKAGREQVDKLIADNADLKEKLNQAQKTITELNTSAPEKDAQIASLKKDLASASDRLADALKQSQENLNAMHDLQDQLESSTTELAQVKSAGATSDDAKKLTEENNLLRGIVKRERNEEAYRDQEKQLALEELSKLHIPADSIVVAKIEDIAKPLKLTDQERALFKQTDVSINDNNITVSAEKPAGDTVATPSPSPSPASSATPQPSATPATALASPSPSPVASPAASPSTPRVQTSITPPVSPQLVPQANEAKEQFERGNYRDAEKTYRAMLEQEPDNIYILDNLGVVLFRSGKLKPAEEIFKKALVVSPDDEFSHRTLGIVYYTEGNFEAAVGELTKALTINPKDAIGHNYLGITASAKEWPEAARSELEKAVAIDPDYADAQFNLAVIYLITPPVDKDNAKKHYKRALELGSQPDTNFEQQLNK